MGELLAERRQVIHQMFREYDTGFHNELSPEQLQELHAEIRIGGISLQQVDASIRYCCASDTSCDESELFDVLQEMDRRYFLIQDFRWEFSMLDHEMKDSVTEDQARWMMRAVHGDLFSKRKWQRFLMNRAAPGSGVTFAEIEVDLCNIPSREAIADEQYEEDKEREVRQRRRLERAKFEKEEREKLEKRREEEKKRRAEEDKKRKREEAERRRLAEEERVRKLKEKEEEEKRRKQLEQEEERGRREAKLRVQHAKEDEERKQKQVMEEDERRLREEEERKRKEEEELAEMRRLQEIAEKVKMEQELEREKDLEAAKDVATKAKEAADLERLAEDDIQKAQLAIKQAKDAKARQEAEERENSARLRAKEQNHRKIRLNLKVAIKERTKEKLVPAVSHFKKAKLPDDEGDLAKAERIIKEIKARDDLDTAMMRRKLLELEKAITYVKVNGFEIQLATQMVEANRLLITLKRLERIRAEILELKQSTVAEIRSYQKPPLSVHNVMTATLLLLGHKERETKEDPETIETDDLDSVDEEYADDWKAVQALVGKTGKESLKRRCLGLDAGTLNLSIAKKAKAIYEQYKLEEVRDVSAGAATFFVWGTSMIEEAEARGGQPGKS